MFGAPRRRQSSIWKSGSRPEVECVPDMTAAPRFPGTFVKQQFEFITCIHAALVQVAVNRQLPCGTCTWS